MTDTDSGGSVSLTKEVDERVPELQGELAAGTPYVSMPEEEPGHESDLSSPRSSPPKAANVSAAPRPRPHVDNGT